MKFIANNAKNTLFGIISKWSINQKNRMTAIATFIPIILIFITVTFGYFTIQSEIKSSQQNIELLRNNELELITYSLIENSNKARIQNSYVKDNIVNNLTKAYDGDVEKMKIDFESRDINTDFYKILYKNISNVYLNNKNDNNRIYIGSKDGVIMDGSYNYAENTFKSWEEIIPNSPEPDMIKRTIESFKNPYTYKTSLWIDNNTSRLTGIQYIEPVEVDSNKSLEEFVETCVLNGDLTTLMQYNIIVVSYIFDTGDIFGVPDVEYGQLQDNNKLYIIHTLSIKDIIESNSYLNKYINNTQILIENEVQTSNEIIRARAIAILIYVILEAIAFFGVWYLAEFFIYFHSIFDEKDDENKK